MLMISIANNLGGIRLYPCVRNGETRVEGCKVYDWLVQEKLFVNSLTVADLISIKGEGLEKFRRFFLGKTLHAPSSSILRRASATCPDQYLLVPCLFERAGELVIFWRWVGYSFDSRDFVPCF